MMTTKRATHSIGPEDLHPSGFDRFTDAYGPKRCNEALDRLADDLADAPTFPRAAQYGDEAADDEHPVAAANHGFEID